MANVTVLSPHSDDAVISLGNMLYHQKSNCTILVPFNQSIENILGVKGDVTAMRKTEDRKIEVNYGFRFIYGEFPDTSKRNLPWNEKLPVDPTLLNVVEEWIARVMPQSDTIYIPIASGQHPDHVITNIIGQRLTQHSPIIAAYLDQPYFHDRNDIKRGSIVQIPFEPEFKREMLSAYASQLTEERITLLTQEITCEYYFHLEKTACQG